MKFLIMISKFQKFFLPILIISKGNKNIHFSEYYLIIINFSLHFRLDKFSQPLNLTFFQNYSLFTDLIISRNFKENL